MADVLVEFINILVGGITQIASGLGAGINQYVADLFLVTGTDGAVTGLSTFGGVIAIFGGLALSIGLTRLVFDWVRSIGN